MLDIIVIVGSLASIVAVFIAVFSTSWTKQRKVVALIVTVVFLAVPTACYFYLINFRTLSGEFEWQWAGNAHYGLLTIGPNKYGHPATHLIVKKLIPKPEG